MRVSVRERILIMKIIGRIEIMSKNEIMVLYKICREDLKTKRKNIRYCNYSFFEKFIEYQRLAFLAAKDNKYNDEYKKYLEEHIFKTDLYIKNSGCYCEFLSVAYDHKSEFKRLLNIE